MEGGNMAGKSARLMAVVWAAGTLGAACSAEPSEQAQRYAAFEICTQFVEDRLRSPGSAEFPNEHQDDGEVIISGPFGADEAYRVSSHVDSQNGFGAMVRSTFTCQVRPVGDGQWRLIDLDLVQLR